MAQPNWPINNSIFHIVAVFLNVHTGEPITRTMDISAPSAAKARQMLEDLAVSERTPILSYDIQGAGTYVKYKVGDIEGVKNVPDPTKDFSESMDNAATEQPCTYQVGYVTD